MTRNLNLLLRLEPAAAAIARKPVAGLPVPSGNEWAEIPFLGCDPAQQLVQCRRSGLDRHRWQPIHRFR